MQLKSPFCSFSDNIYRRVCIKSKTFYFYIHMTILNHNHDYLTYFQNMKSLILTFAVAFIATLSLNAQALQCSPEKPIAGETVTLSYDQNQTILVNEKELKATALLLNSNPTGDRFQIEDVRICTRKRHIQSQTEPFLPMPTSFTLP